MGSPDGRGAGRRGLRGSGVNQVDPLQLKTGLDQLELHIDIAASSFRVGAGLMRGLDTLLRGWGVEPGNADVQPGSDRKAAVTLAQVDFGIDGRFGWQLQLPLERGVSQRAFEAVRPSS